jgi:hypothetical protein
MEVGCWSLFKDYYLVGLTQLPQVFRRVAFKKRTLEEELREASNPAPAST